MPEPSQAFCHPDCVYGPTKGSKVPHLAPAPAPGAAELTARLAALSTFVDHFTPLIGCVVESCYQTMDVPAEVELARNDAVVWAFRSVAAIARHTTAEFGLDS